MKIKRSRSGRKCGAWLTNSPHGFLDETCLNLGTRTTISIIPRSRPRNTRWFAKVLDAKRRSTLASITLQNMTLQLHLKKPAFYSLEIAERFRVYLSFNEVIDHMPHRSNSVTVERYSTFKCVFHLVAIKNCFDRQVD